jgi:electron transfer flavoprotein beta subunit
VSAPGLSGWRFLDFLVNDRRADLRLNQPRYATLPNIMKAKKKPISQVTPEQLGVKISQDLEIVEVVEPAKRKAGVMVASG